MNKDYTKYRSEELLEDDFFVQSNLSPSLETIHFWKKQIASGLDEHEYQLAIFFLNSVRVKKSQMSEERQGQLWENIMQLNKKRELIRYRRFRTFMYTAACIAVLAIFSISYIYINTENVPDVESIAQLMPVALETDEIQLVMPNKQIPISGQDSKIEHDKKGTVVVNSEKIVGETSKSSDSSKRPDEFNQLIVPKGKRSTLIFEDGTKVWVNAGSRIVYPVVFAKKKREIYVDGEVYLNVTHDEKRPFIVRTKDMKVKVLGTSFNVMSYEADQNSAVVLVTGSVEVGTEEKDCRLSPNELFSYQNGKSLVKRVDVNDYISWKDGLYTYRSENLSVILDRLSRYYGKKISYKSDVASLKCSGKLDMQEDLDVVLNGLSHTAPILYKKVDDEYVLVKIGE